MATKYTRYTKKSSISWAAGNTDNPASEAAYRVEDLSYDVEQAEVVATNTFIGEYQGAPPRPAGRYAITNFTTELRALTQSAKTPYEGSLLRACGFDETLLVTGGRYGPQYTLGDLHLLTMSPAGILDPIDLRTNVDREEGLAKNCVGNVRVRLQANQIPKMDFTFRGQVDDGVADVNDASYTEDTVPTIVVGQLPVPVQNSDFRLVDMYGEQVLYAITEYTDETTGSVSDIVTIAGDHTSEFTPGTVFKIDLSVSGNNGLYIVGSSSYDAGNDETNILLGFPGISISGYVTELTGDTVTTDVISFIWRAYSNLVVLGWDIDLGNVIDERADMNAPFGFGQPLITSRNPTCTLQIEAPSLGEFNPYELFIKQTPLRISCKVNRQGNGITIPSNAVGDTTTIYMDVRINAMPTKSDVNGKVVFTISAMQDVGTYVNINSTSITPVQLTLIWRELQIGLDYYGVTPTVLGTVTTN